jgi:hypothetical protein
VVVWLASGISWWHDSFSFKKCSKKTIATLHGMNLEPSRKEVSPVASCQFISLFGIVFIYNRNY